METLRILSGWLEERLLWIVVTGVSWSLSLAIVLIMAKGVSPVLPQEVGLVIGGSVGGGLIGFAQWLFLRLEVKGFRLWLLATAGGWNAGLVIATLAVMVIGWIPGQVIGGILGGSVCCLAQGAALHPGMRERREWILIMTAGWIVAFGITQGNGDLGTFADEIIKAVVAGTVGWAVMGVLAAATLVLLFPKFGKWKEITSSIKQRTRSPSANS